MGTVRAFRCVTCGGEFPPDGGAFTCPACGPLEGTLEADLVLPPPSGRGPGGTPPSLWRYLDFLPVPDAGPLAAFPVGGTPLVEAPALARALGAKAVWVKDDTRNPSGSLKDRATALALSAARGATTFAAASTGNAASSLAALGAASGRRAVVFLPEDAPRAKLAQVRIHGARVFRVRGSYDEAYDLCAAACAAFGWVSRNTATNPFLGEGKKTAALEIAEQLGWEPPDRVFVPAGDGAVLAGVHKGFADLAAAAWTGRVPRIFGVQSEGSAALARAFAAGHAVPSPVAPRTLADSISVGLPRDGVKALRAARDSGGGFVTVSDEAILEAQGLLARETGIFAEPAASASLAGAMAAGALAGERVVLLATGSGLKDVESALRAAGPVPEAVAPTLEALEERLDPEERP